MILSLATALLMLAAQMPWVYLQTDPADALSARQLGWLALQILSRGQGVVLASDASQIVLSRDAKMLRLSTRDAPAQSLEMTPRPTLLLELDHHLAALVSTQRDAPAPARPMLHMMLEERAFTPRAEALAEGLASVLLSDGVALAGAPLEGIKILCVRADGSGVTWLDEPLVTGCGEGASQLGASAPAQGSLTAWFAQISGDVRRSIPQPITPDIVTPPLLEAPVQVYEPLRSVLVAPGWVYRLGGVDTQVSVRASFAPWRRGEVFASGGVMQSSTMDLDVLEWSVHLGGAYVWMFTSRVGMGGGLAAGARRHRYASMVRRGALGAWSVEAPLWLRWKPWRGLVVQPGVQAGWSSMRVAHARDGVTLWSRSPWHLGGQVGVGWMW